MSVCYRCNNVIDAVRIGRTDTCPVCDADLHCCRNCRHFDEGAYNQCREPQAERVIDKDRSNFCDFFSLRDRHAGDHSTIGSSRKANPLDALFKTKKTESKNLGKDDP